ncbi:MAG: peroxiredoxin [Chrysiogenetes bacterium]|nr:peroxiredoxin [Chrysiogenetes bacterium]
MSEETETNQPPRLELNGPAPDFTANTTHGQLTLSKWAAGDWVILFSHPADFTPVCTTEFMAFAERAESFKKKGAKLLGNSIDSIHSHIAWVRNIKQNFGVDIPFPIIADLDQKVAQLYNMVHEASSATAAVRCVFFIDPKMRVRAMIYYPLNVGRNFDEIERVMDAFNTVDKHGVACPADWRPGDDVIVPPPGTTEDAEKRVNDKSLKVTDWYFSKKSL